MPQHLLHYYRYVLLLEGLWDQLEGVVQVLQRVSVVSEIEIAAFAKMTACRARCGELIEALKTEELQRSAVMTAHRGDRTLLANVMMEVADALRCARQGESAEWLPIAYQAQDAVCAALHTLRTRDDDYAGGLRAVGA